MLPHGRKVQWSGLPVAWLVVVEDDGLVPTWKALDSLSYVTIRCVPCSGPVILSPLPLIHPSTLAITGNVTKGFRFTVRLEINSFSASARGIRRVDISGT